MAADAPRIRRAAAARAPRVRRTLRASGEQRCSRAANSCVPGRDAGSSASIDSSSDLRREGTCAALSCSMGSTFVFGRGESPLRYGPQMVFFLLARTRAFRRGSRCRSARRAQRVQIAPGWRMRACRQICHGSATSDRFECELPWPSRNRLFSPAAFCCC